MPIYHVKTPSGERLVNAATKAGAINHVIRPGVTAEAISASDMLDLPRAAPVRRGDEDVEGGGMTQARLIPTRAEEIFTRGNSPKKLAAQTRKNLAFIRQKISELAAPWQDIDNSIAGSESTLMAAFDVFENDINESVKYLEETA